MGDMMDDFNSQQVQRAIEAQLAQSFARGRRRKLNDGAREGMRQNMIELLVSLQLGGDIPDDVNVHATQAVTHEIDPFSVDVQLPVLLRLYIQDGVKSVRTPRFEHDSGCCQFLGHGNGCDLYWCSQYSRMAPTVIARRSSRPSDYQSGLMVARVLPVTEPLGLALALATEAGLFGDTDSGQQAGIGA